ncbi:MAG: DUF4190 domain-containing protein [Planctomycetota bacterium]|jgi:hypothetical protein
MENVSKISSEEELLQLRNEGKRPADPGESKPVSTSGLAIASLVFSLLVPFGCIPAIVCGHIALRQIKKDSSVHGRGLALAGLIIGYVILGLFIVPTMLWVSYVSLEVPMEVIELKSFPLDDTEGLITQSGVTIDRKISSDGNGSLRIEAAELTTIRLFETGNIDIESARLIYQARLRTEDVEGQRKT